MGNLTNSFILLAIGLTILWLAATNRLTNWAKAWSDLTGQPVQGSTAVSSTGSNIQGAVNLGNQVGNIINQATNNGLPGDTSGGGGGGLSLPIGTDPGASSTANALEAGGGISYHLPTLPQLGTLNSD